MLGIVRAWNGPTETPPGGNGAIATDTSGNVGVGTSSPQSKLHISGPLPRILLFDSDAAISSSNPAWSVRSVDSGSLIIQTTSNYSAYTDVFTIAGSTGNITIAQDLTVSGGDLTVSKINVSTIDPVYTIDGERYATYVASMIGVKEEVTGLLHVDKEKVIDFRSQAKGSDLWLFAKATDLEKNFKDMAVLLTPSFDGNVWYEKDMENLRLIIHADNSGEISYRLTAPRFDWISWPNVLLDGSFPGLIINTGTDGAMISQ